MKIFFRRIHLYLSLAAGLVILTACATGAILVFEKELQMAFNKQRYYVAPVGKKLPVNTMMETVTKAFPGTKVTGIKVYEATTRSAEITISAPQKRGVKREAASNAGKIAVRPAGGRQPGFTVFMNPYTGAILEKYSYQKTFFYQVFALHRWLLGTPDSIGKYIVGISTFIFLFIIITGLVLWWPKTKAVFLKRIKLKNNAGWKRLTHDLHLVFGFYSGIFLFIMAFTGLAWSFEWFNKGIYAVTSSPLQPPPLPKSHPVLNSNRISYDAALETVRTENMDAEFYTMSLPKDSSEAIAISFLPKNAVHESATDAVYIDQWSGAVLGKLSFANRSLGARVRSTFKPVHTGSIWGLPSKMVALLVCLMGVVLPITGVVMWLNRTRKKKKAPITLGARL